jgi:hypothetical protein
VHHPAVDHRERDLRLRNALQRDAQDVSVEHDQIGGEALPDLTGLGLLV